METQGVYHSIIVLRSLGFKIRRKGKNKHDANGVEVTSKHLQLLAALAKDVMSRAHEVQNDKNN